MSNIDEFPIVSDMQEDKKFVDEYELETDKGTKRMKEKFYEVAVAKRNKWIEEKRNTYNEIANGLRNEIINRIPRIMPPDCTETYAKMAEDVSTLLDVVQLSSHVSSSFKLKIDYILSGINDLTSLEDLNQRIREFIRRFKEFGIPLTIQDFKYTMFTEMYMNTFFENSDYDSVKDTFEEIYFKCPDIKLQLKMNLQYIIEQYTKQLDAYTVLLKTKMFQQFSIPLDGDSIGRYANARFELGDRKATDEYYNAQLFIKGTKKITDYLTSSSTRKKIFDSFTFSGDYNGYSEEEKKLYNDSMMGFYLTLNELKKFYRYEFILKDLVSYYKDKASAKGQYTAKKKEIEKLEKQRIGFYNQYLKACGIGFLAKKSEAKQKFVMLQMNNHIRTLKDAYDELHDLEIRYQVSLLEDSASVYDLFLVSLTSFPFLEKNFLTDDFEEETLEETITDYLKFIYNPDNGFLRKVNGLNDYNIPDIVAEKYHLLKLNVTSEMVQPETIDATLQDVSFINLIQNIERSRISLEKIDNLCNMQAILKTNSEE